MSIQGGKAKYHYRDKIYILTTDRQVNFGPCLQPNNKKRPHAAKAKAAQSTKKFERNMMARMETQALL